MDNSSKWTTVFAGAGVVVALVAAFNQPIIVWLNEGDLEAQIEYVASYPPEPAIEVMDSLSGSIPMLNMHIANATRGFLEDALPDNEVQILSVIKKSFPDLDTAAAKTMTENVAMYSRARRMDPQLIGYRIVPPETIQGLYSALNKVRMRPAGYRRATITNKGKQPATNIRLILPGTAMARIERRGQLPTFVETVKGDVGEPGDIAPKEVVIVTGWIASFRSPPGIANGDILLTYNGGDGNVDVIPIERNRFKRRFYEIMAPMAPCCLPSS